MVANSMGWAGVKSAAGGGVALYSAVNIGGEACRRDAVARGLRDGLGVGVKAPNAGDAKPSDPARDVERRGEGFGQPSRGGSSTARPESSRLTGPICRSVDQPTVTGTAGAAVSDVGDEEAPTPKRCGGFGPVYLPTAAEIAAECRAIRLSWSFGERASRREDADKANQTDEQDFAYARTESAKGEQAVDFVGVRMVG